MKGLILSGGRGTRLRPITYTSAKQLVPVANKPILFYAVEDMVECGITDIGIIVGETAEEVVAAVGDGSQFGAAVTWIHQPEPLGLAHCVLVAREFLGQDDFVMYLGDNMLEQGLRPLVESFVAARSSDDPPAASILLSEVPDPHRFGVARLGPDGRVAELVEKPVDPPSNLALVGVYLFTAAVHDAVAAVVPSARGELEITDAIDWLIDQGRTVHHQLLDGWWLDTGKKDPLLESNQRVLETLAHRVDGTLDDRTVVEGPVVVEAGATVVNCRLVGPVVVGAGAYLDHASVGPDVAVGPGCRIERSSVEHSVLLDGARIADVPRLVESLVGRGTVVEGTQGAAPAGSGRGVRLMVGDDCVIEL
ncbi:MAG: glucose-1-phosphate thymidylyltransferase [Actinomycetes bacterium]